MDDRDDAMQALDEFATRKAVERQTLVPAFTVHPPPPSLFHGTVAVIAPRNEADIRQEIVVKAAAAAADWYYSFDAKSKDGTKKEISGPTIGLANAVHLIYGHAEVDAWMSGEGVDYYEFTARWIDVEKGVSMTRIFRQRKGAARMGSDQARNMEIDVAIGMSKAIRNVIVNALADLCNFAYEQARKSTVIKIGQKIEYYRQEVPARLSEIVDMRRVELAIGRPVQEWVARDIAKVIAMGKAVTEGMATVDDVFPQLPADKPETRDTTAQLDELAKKPPGGLDPSPGDKAAAEAPPVEAAAADEPRRKAIDKLFELASDRRLSPQERLEAIDETTPQFEDVVDKAFLAGLVPIAVRLAREEIKQTTALKMVEAL